MVGLPTQFLAVGEAAVSGLPIPDMKPDILIPNFLEPCLNCRLDLPTAELPRFSSPLLTVDVADG